ncbi:uncharacterized protein LOC112040961 isoform X2 [Quercus suber]|uniref:uncharacterized protein LOC112040961 isoform X2 n=1 Tax=Quercus suber TaxID=58331 RepID=UPI0032DFC731
MSMRSNVRESLRHKQHGKRWRFVAHPKRFTISLYFRGVCNAMREKFDGPATAFSVFCHCHTFRTITKKKQDKEPSHHDLPELQTVKTHRNGIKVDDVTSTRSLNCY